MQMTLHSAPCYHIHMQEGAHFYRCRNCGRFAPMEKVEMDQFCSLECARQYRQCPVCGRYFLPDVDNPYCSPACSEANITTEEVE